MLHFIPPHTGLSKLLNSLLPFHPCTVHDNTNIINTRFVVGEISPVAGLYDMTSPQCSEGGQLISSAATTVMP